jgi:hypothetical protein
LEDYESQIRSIYAIKYDKKDWISSQCSCVFWAKNYYCHHVIGIAVTKKKAAYLDVNMQIEIGHTRKRGQPKKTASALNKLKDYSSSSDSTSSSDSEPSPVKKVPKKGS